MTIVRLDLPVTKRRVRVGSLALEKKLHLEEIERLNREIPLPGARTRGFVFTR